MVGCAYFSGYYRLGLHFEASDIKAKRGHAYWRRLLQDCSRSIMHIHFHITRFPVSKRPRARLHFCHAWVDFGHIVASRPAEHRGFRVIRAFSCTPAIREYHWAFYGQHGWEYVGRQPAKATPQPRWDSISSELILTAIFHLRWSSRLDKKYRLPLTLYSWTSHYTFCGRISGHQVGVRPSKLA